MKKRNKEEKGVSVIEYKTKKESLRIPLHCLATCYFRLHYRRREHA